MDSTVITSLIVSCIAISVIFTVLVILIYTIRFLVHLIPYEEPPASKLTTKVIPQTSPQNIVTPEVISAITAVMTTHLRKSPQEFNITQIIPK